MPTRRDCLKTLAAATAIPAAAQQPDIKHVRHVDFIHHSHTDVGFTDMPSVCRDLQVRFLDSAMEACVANKTFRWTCECTLTIDDYWRAMPKPRRDLFLRLVKSGQMDVMALPFNQAPFMDALEWRQAFDWLPASLWRELNPRAAMQNDVNGMPRAGAMLLLDRGISHLLMGINADSGGPPFRRPDAFWWRMPDGRKMFVWLGEHYGTGYSWFEPKGWQHGQAKAADPTLRPPRTGDHLRADEASVRAAHAHFTARLQKLEAAGYNLPRLIVSYTNQWRYDNDPAFPPLAPFIDAWNKLGLQPTLRFATATEAVFDMERAAASLVRTYDGEWTDWWANGDASGPREVAASRAAKRSIAAALSPAFGETSQGIKQKVSEMLRDLCLFDEHTWGANISISDPYALDTIAQYTEKSLLAYRPMGHAELLAGDRARHLVASQPEGTYVINASPEPYSGWTPDRKAWVENLAPHSFRRLEAAPATSSKPVIENDSGGWPVSASWPGMTKPLFSAGLGDFLSVFIAPPARRSSNFKPDALKRAPATYGEVKLEETAHTLIYSQPINHPSVANATRRLEIFRSQPRARLTVRFNRLASLPPEVLFVAFPFPTENVLPRFSNGGVPFTPYTDQLEGSCRDYYAIDSWAHYLTPAGHWLWVTRDAPMVTVGGPHTWQRRTTAPADPNRLWAMVFDNFWHTNFVADSHGLMEFQFELAWRDALASPASLAETLVSTPLVVVHPGPPDSPAFFRTLFRPGNP